MPGNTAYLVPFSHLDLFWLGEENECLSRVSRIISRAMQLCRRRLDFRFLIEDVVFVEYFLRSHPEAQDELKALVQSGQIELGPKWAGIMQNAQISEDLIRNTLYAAAYTRRELEYEGEVMHLGDLPGFTPQYPQIATGLGIRYIIKTRCGPAGTPLYYWQAPDGSKVLTWYALFGYHWAWSRRFERSVDEAEVMAEEMERIAELTPGPILVHWGIDNVLPPPDLPDRVDQWNAKHERQLVMVTPRAYFAAAQASGAAIPTMQGEGLSLWPA